MTHTESKITEFDLETLEKVSGGWSKEAIAYMDYVDSLRKKYNLGNVHITVVEKYCTPEELAEIQRLFQIAAKAG